MLIADYSLGDALLTIIGDLFRDHQLSGWWKAVWILFLIFIPFVTALVYLIARGKGMADRRDCRKLALPHRFHR